MSVVSNPSGAPLDRNFGSTPQLNTKSVYTSNDVASGLEEIGQPGEFPFTRGVHEGMYRSRLWTMRQFAGYGTPRETNARFRVLLDKGQTGLSTAFDLPTLMGLDSDDPRSGGEVGRLGVAVDTIEDIKLLFDQIDLGHHSVSMTINAPAIILMAYYIAAADEFGVPRERLRGTIQNDILKEFHAQNEFVFPPGPSVRLVVDVIEYCTQEVPHWNTVSISGYHIREAGSTAAQELAFTLADGRHYVDESLRRGLEIDCFAPRLSFFFNAHNNFLEEIAKYRAARSVWAHLMRDTYGAADPRSWKLRFHAQTAGCSLQEQQPEVNLTRVAYQAMAAVMGGCQSLHTNCMDETLALPTEHAATLALRTQQVLALETGITQVVDPFGGSYVVEAQTEELASAAASYFQQIESLGGMLPAIEANFFRQQIAEAAYQNQLAIDSGKQRIVGVTDFQEPPANEIEVLAIDPQVEPQQIETLRQVRKLRSQADVDRSLKVVRTSAGGSENLLPALLQAAKARATVGELMQAMGDEFGYHELRQL